MRPSQKQTSQICPVSSAQRRLRGPCPSSSKERSRCWYASTTNTQRTLRRTKIPRCPQTLECGLQSKELCLQPTARWLSSCQQVQVCPCAYTAATCADMSSFTRLVSLSLACGYTRDEFIRKDDLDGCNHECPCKHGSKPKAGFQHSERLQNWSYGVTSTESEGC